MAIPGGLPAYKQEFLEMQVVYSHNLLLGVWYLLYTGHGREHILPWLILRGESRPRKFDRSRIGFERHENVTVSYDTEIVQNDVKMAEPAASYVQKMTGKSIQPLEVFEPANAAALEEAKNIFSFVVGKRIHVYTSNKLHNI